MTSFIIRVELHNATSKHYDDLAKNLAAIGVVDTIRGNDGRRFKLPPAEYHYEGAVTLQQVYNSVTSVASRVLSNNAVLVTESNGCMWTGLTVV